MRYYTSNLLAIVFSVFLVLLSAINLYAEQGNRLALLIGNGNYEHAGNLANPINDVRAIKSVLEQLGFAVFKYENCSQTTMKRAIDDFGKKLKDKDVGLFFYAGHGVQVKGYNYLVPINAKLENENDAEYDCVRAGRILAKMESAGSNTNIVILDACRANPFVRAWRRGAEGNGLAFMNAPSGSLIAYSTAPGQTALDGGGKNSPYTGALLQYINEPNITVIQMFQKVRSTVMKQSDKKQIPWESTSLRGDFYFKEGGSIKVVKKENEEPSIIKTQKDVLDDGETMFNRGLSYIELKQYTKAIQEFTKAIELNLNYANAYFYRGFAYLNLQQYTKAIQEFTKAIDLDPKNAAAYDIRGFAYLNLQQYTKAIQDYTQVIDLDPKNANAYFTRGFFYYTFKQYTKAIQDLTKAIDLDPKNAAAYNNRAFAYGALKQYTNAIQDLTQVINLDPKNADAYHRRGLGYFSLKQYTKTIQDLTKAIDLDPKNADVYYFRGLAYGKLKQYTKAIQDYTQVIDLDPKNADAYNNRGLIYYLLNSNIESCGDAKKACNLGSCKLLETLKQYYKCE